MNDEIKETLEYKIDFLTKSLNIGIPTKNRRYFNDIKYYITNLQKENERLKEENKHIFANVNDDELLISNAMNYAEAQDYKSRVEKAVYNCEKSIESINKKLENNKEPFEVVDGKIIYLNDYQVCRLKAIRMKSKELLNILQNGSDASVKD